MKPSSVSKFGIEDGSCFLCGATVFTGFSTAASAILGGGYGVVWCCEGVEDTGGDEKGQGW